MSCGMVVPTSGTVIMCFLASSTPLRIASGTSPALPRPAPTRPLPSPTTTSALKEKRRPPFTTLATRLRETIFSWNSLLRSSPPPRRSRSRSMRIAIVLELQSGRSGRIGQGLDPAMIEIAAAIEDDRLHARGDGPLGHGAAHRRGGGRVGGGALQRALQLALDGRGGGQGASLGVVDHLRGDVVQAAEDGQPRPRHHALDPLADTAVALVARGTAIVFGVHRATCPSRPCRTCPPCGAASRRGRARPCPCRARACGSCGSWRRPGRPPPCPRRSR